MATHTFTRDELYRLVWSEPMTKIAARYKMSDNGLAKACKRAIIPLPPRGYWAKIRAGHKVEKPDLPDAAPGTPRQVTINPPRAMPPRPTPPQPESVTDAIEQAKATIQPVEVKNTLRNAHSIVAKWLKDNKRARDKDRFGYLGWRPEAIDGTPLERRKLRILSALFFALEQTGYALNATGESHAPVEATRNHEALKIQIRERIKHNRRKITEEDRKSDRYYSEDQVWTTDRTPTGELILKISAAKGWCPEKEWKETKGPNLEEQLTQVVIHTVGMIETLHLRTLELRAREERYRKEADERRRLENERKKEEIRFQRLLSYARNRKDAVDIRDLVAALENKDSVHANSEEFITWKTWALGQADRIDPQLSDEVFDLETDEQYLN